MPNPPLKLFSAGGDLNSQPAGASAPSSDDRRQRELDRLTGTAKAKTMQVEFGVFVKLLSQAMADDCTWLDDFADDTIKIDADLHEVLLTYQSMRHRGAA
jgi:hypothetical protein